MSEQLADVGRRIATVRQLGVVVNAMRGIAGARARQSRALLPSIRTYADTAARAVAQARRLDGGAPSEGLRVGGGRPGLILFGAEQGFAGAFPELVLDAAAGDLAAAHVFLIGSRSAAIAEARGLAPEWRVALPSRAAALVRTATAIVDAVYDLLARDGAVPVTMVHQVWSPGRGAMIVRRPLLPFELPAAAATVPREPPLVNMQRDVLIEQLAQEYVFAVVCEAAVEAFAAENEARLAAMAAAHTSIGGKLAALQTEERLMRQEEITAEVVELAAGARSRR